jgi:hypothetical protein
MLTLHNLENDEKGEYYVGDDSDEEELPFACFICRQHFKKPVVTLYFRVSYYLCDIHIYSIPTFYLCFHSLPQHIHLHILTILILFDGSID